MLKNTLKQFELLSASKKRFLSSPVVLSTVERVEKKYGVKLALILMEVAIDDSKIDNLDSFLEQKLSIEKSIASQIGSELNVGVFQEFLNIGKEQAPKIPKVPKAPKIVAPNFKVNTNQEAQPKQNFTKPVKNDTMNNGEQVVSENLPQTIPSNLPVVKKEETQQSTIVKKPIIKSKDKISETSFIKPSDNSPDDSELIFNKSDEEELKTFENKTKELKFSAGEMIDWEKKAENIMLELNIDLSSDLLKNRFKNILISVLKGVRNFIDLKDVLEKRVEEGGMGFKGDLAEKIIEAVRADHKNKPIKDEPVSGREISPPKVDLPETREQRIKPIENEASKTNKADMDKVSSAFGLPEKGENHENTKTQKHKNIGLFGKDTGNQIMKPIKREVKVNKINEARNEAREINESIPTKPGILKKLFSNKKKEQTPKLGKPKIEDIKKVKIKEEPRLVGPIEEIEALTIDDFRDWSDDPLKSAENIKIKINVLAEESLEKGSLGIKAWKKSEISKLYLNILNSAMIKHLPVSQIIKNLEEERKITLTEKEFEAIAKLNQNLRF
ncbi:hypothetical protein HOD96_01035 [Candidatus Falkowbacteria bacterium]|jgi:hypothetical protein|nr:hypothetical protein [Candidatus Falkowbacteria bacterium]MBT4433382.1 hypothetical protein [Candidatus Falkowbacteria bacterium]